HRRETDVWPSLHQPGEVLADRYELQHELAVDPFVRQYHAFDLETHADVSLRLIHPHLFSDELSLAATRDRLESALGIGGRYLSPLLDVGDDDSTLFVVEGLPNGRCLREMLDRRFARD